MNNDLGVNNKISKINRLPSTNPNYIESESYSNKSKISNRVDNTVGDEVSFIRKIKPNHSNPDYPKVKCHSNNGINNNPNIGIGEGNKELLLNNLLESLE